MLFRSIGRKPTKTGTSLDFSRRFYEYHEHLIAEWQDDVLSLIEDFVERLKSGYFPKRTLWCTNKFGTCPFMNVCTLPEAHRDMMLHTSAYSTYIIDCSHCIYFFNCYHFFSFKKGVGYDIRTPCKHIKTILTNKNLLYKTAPLTLSSLL